MEITEARLASLPRWARIEIQRLTANLAYAEKKLAAGPDNSDTFADPYSEDARRPLGLGTIIEFGTEPGQRVRVRREKSGRLDISGDEGLVVWPRSSNGIEVEARRW